MTFSSNPRFDPRMTTIPTLGLRDREVGAYWRGAIIRDANLNDQAAKTAYRVNFLFNPSTISVSHDAGAKLTEEQQATDGQYVAASGIGQVTFSLIFDRTYEVNSIYGGADARDHGGDPRSLGVRADVEALYRVTGVFDVTATGVNATQIQPMQSHNCYIFFGGDTSNGTSPAFSNSLSYYGYISQLSVNYTHFTNQMVPQRCGVAITVELTQKGPSQ